MECNNSVNNLFKMQRVVNSAVDYVVLTDDVIINMTNTSVARTVTLPAPSITNIGKIFTIKDASGASSTNNITVSSATALIDGKPSSVINQDWEAVLYSSDGSNYCIVGSYLEEGSYFSSGTWTPTYNGTTPGTGIYTLQLGSYVKINPLVVATFQVLLTSTTASGNAKIEGLPFATATTGFSQFSSLAYKQSQGKTKILCIKLDQNGTGGTIVDQDIDNTTLDISGTFSYISV